MKHINKIFFLILFALGICSEIQIPPIDLDDWNVLNEKKPWIGCQDYQKLPWCRSIEIFPYSIDKIEVLIGHFDNYSAIFNSIKSSNMIDTNIVYLKIDYPLFLSDRDYIVKYNTFSKGDNLFYQWKAIKHLEVPVYDNIVRLVNAAGEWHLVPINKDSTRVSYSWNGELLGDFPSFYLETARKRQGVEIIDDLKRAMQKNINE